MKGSYDHTKKIFEQQQRKMESQLEQLRSEVDLYRERKVADEDTDEESVYQIVGEHEADIRDGRLSFTAPLARGLMNKAAGDRVEVVTPKGSKAYEILKVKFI